MNSILDYHTSLTKGHCTVEDTVRGFLSEIENSKDFNIYLRVFDKEAIYIAKQIDTDIKNGIPLKKLSGVVISLKDVLCYKDHGLTAGSRILEGFTSQFTGTAVQNLIDEGAIIIGMTNCDEFAMGSTNENSAYGVTPNGVNPNHVAGGSSGGAAVSVYKNTCHVGLGSDTGGSVRQPASFHGLVGIKPSYGRISRYGLIAYGSSFDQIGTIAHDIDSAAIVLETMYGFDSKDGTSSNSPISSYLDYQMSGSLSISYINDIINHDAINEDVRKSIQKVLLKLKESNHNLISTDFEYLNYLVPTYYVLTTAEASSNLGRYDGIRYGRRSGDSDTLDELYKNTRSEGFGIEVKRRIMLGSFVLSSGYYDAYYTKAQKVRRLITDKMRCILEDTDILILPMTTDVASKIGELTDDPVEMYLSDLFTVLANLSGLPSISIPLGADESGLPFGLQIISKKFSEDKMIATAKMIANTIKQVH